MKRAGFGMIQAIIGLALLAVVILAFSELILSTRKQERAQRARLLSKELLATAAGQLQSQSYEIVTCLCCRALKDPLPSHLTFQRKSVASCPEYCSSQKPIHGYRGRDLAESSPEDSDGYYLTVEQCDATPDGQAIDLILNASWRDHNRTGQIMFEKIRFLKSRW